MKIYINYIRFMIIKYNKYIVIPYKYNYFEFNN